MPPPNILPQRASVTPRARPANGGESLPLDYYLSTHLNHPHSLAINLYGTTGSGKSTALAHLAATLQNPRLSLLDDPSRFPVTHNNIVLFTSRQKDESFGDIHYEISPWQLDDIIEYLLARHAAQCKSVMARLNDALDIPLDGLPELCAIVLDELAADDSLRSNSAALRRFTSRQIASEPNYAAKARASLDRIIKYSNWPILLPKSEPQILRFRPPTLLLAAEALAAEILTKNPVVIDRPFPAELLHETCKLLRPNPKSIKALEATVRIPRCQSAAASLLISLNPNWRPDGFKLAGLIRAQIPNVHWPKIDLAGAQLEDANLSGADLAHANLEGVTAMGAHCRSANLSHTQLSRTIADEANFNSTNFNCSNATHASFIGALLKHATFRKANFLRTVFTDSNLSGADFTGAALAKCTFERTLLDHTILSATFNGSRFYDINFSSAIFGNADFSNSNLFRCRLENIDLSNVIFNDANLAGSYLTNSRIRNGRLHGIRLHRAGLAHINWENCDLANADFTQASFHLGSSRSGLVGSVIASEGSRTGFYTDDYNDQDFKPPETIRKANLKGCDLRGAKVNQTDFYLVDLRQAKYTQDQAAHFKNCGAILSRPRA